jgi:hypothetical protein
LATLLAATGVRSAFLAADRRPPLDVAAAQATLRRLGRWSPHVLWAQSGDDVVMRGLETRLALRRAAIGPTLEALSAAALEEGARLQTQAGERAASAWALIAGLSASGEPAIQRLDLARGEVTTFGPRTLLAAGTLADEVQKAADECAHHHFDGAAFSADTWAAATVSAAAGAGIAVDFPLDMAVVHPDAPEAPHRLVTDALVLGEPVFSLVIS